MPRAHHDKPNWSVVATYYHHYSSYHIYMGTIDARNKQCHDVVACRWQKEDRTRSRIVCARLRRTCVNGSRREEEQKMTTGGCCCRAYTRIIFFIIASSHSHHNDKRTSEGRSGRWTGWRIKIRNDSLKTVINQYTARPIFVNWPCRCCDKLLVGGEIWKIEN